MFGRGLAYYFFSFGVGRKFSFKLEKTVKHSLCGLEQLSVLGTNHPSIAFRVISCSKVGVEESAPRIGRFFSF